MNFFGDNVREALDKFDQTCDAIVSDTERYKKAAEKAGDTK